MQHHSLRKESTDRAVLSPSEYRNIASSINRVVCTGNPVSVFLQNRVSSLHVKGPLQAGQCIFDLPYNDLAKRRALARPVEAEGRNELERLVRALLR